MNLSKVIYATAVAAALGCTGVSAEHLVILHTNDTHSMIDPDEDGRGGVLRRKVIIDSVRNAEKNVLVVDAGDFVQGTLYFNLFRGEVEQRMMNELGYDIRILGNHEFDNGIDALAELLGDSQAELIATNYDLSDSALAKKFRPFTIREIGDKTVGFIGINLRPEGMISEGNYDGVVYLDAIQAANAAAWWLKHIEKADAVVAVTHIGYDPSMPPGDKSLAALSEDIDIIIGGHSHDFVKPDAATGDRLQPRVKNRAGKDVLVTQTGKSGKNIGKITLDLDDMSADYEVITVDGRLDRRIDRRLAEIIKPYRSGVDSLMNVAIARSGADMPKGSNRLLNFASDFVLARGRAIAPGVDFSIVNKGGLRRGLPKGDITEGMIISLMPFYNYITVIDIKGSDLAEAFDVMASVGGNGVSGNVDATFDRAASKCETVTIDGKPLDPDKTYRVATIDYLVKGGDYMSSLKRGKIVAKSDKVLYNDLINELRQGIYKGKKIEPSAKSRMRQSVK